MVNFEIHDHEIATKRQVKAQGFVEAIAEYLPWPTVKVEIEWNPTQGQAVIVDKATDFKYTVTKI